MRRVNGFTLVELLVAIGIAMTLAALILPAVQAARESSRLTMCRNNLRQMAMSVHAYVEVHNMVPGVQNVALPPTPSTPIPMFRFCYPSIHAQLLPFLDMAPLEDSLNYNCCIGLDYLWSPDDLAPNSTLARTRIALFVCPSDGRARQWAGANSYRGNQSVGPGLRDMPEFPDSGNGVFCMAGVTQCYPIRFQSISDGLSKTAMWSERLVGSDYTSSLDRERDSLIVVGDSRTAAAQVVQCVSANSSTDVGVYTKSGKSWLYSGLHHTTYTHTLTPNSRYTDCLSLDVLPPWGLATARSAHRDTVSVALADGSVRSVSNAIDLKVWRAVGTRNGGESWNSEGSF